MSRVTLAKPTSSPSSSLIGWMTALAQNWLPSLRTRHPSPSHLPSHASFQRPLRHPVPAIFLSVEAREVLTQDFVGRVSLDPLRPSIPTRHVAVRVEHVDRVIGHALDKDPKLALA
jgi:hypothetical protein